MSPAFIPGPISSSPIRILALGDSYTIGEGVASQERWPAQLAQRLRERGTAVDEPQIIAQTGWTTADLAAAIASARLSDPFDLITLLIGVNNQYRGRDLEAYRAEFRDLLCRAIHLAGDRPRRVIVLSIPDWGVTPFAEGRDRARIAKEIDAFNNTNREEAGRAGAKYLDITPMTRESGRDPRQLAEDKLHPSGKMYAGWVNELLSIVEAEIYEGL